MFLATVSAISDGMQYGWASPVVPILQNETISPVLIQESDIVWLESIYMIGGVIGLPITIFLVDRIGRKKTILLASFCTLIAWIIIACANTVWQLYLARVLTGTAGDVAFVSAPMYIAEIADPSIRGFLAATIYIMMLVGIVLVYSIVPFVSIPISSAVGAFWVILQLITFPFMPDSPYFLLLRGKPDKAKKALSKLRARSADVEKELQEITAVVDRQKSEKGRPQDLILVPSNRKALTIMVILNAAQHFSSISVILMNLHTILEDAGPILEAKIAAIIFSILMLLSSSIASTVVDRFGRKILLTLSCILTGIALAILAGYFAFKNAGHDTLPYNWVPVFSIMLYAITFKFGLGVIPIVMTAELFPTSVKAMGMTISDASYVIFSVISIYLYSLMSGLYGLHAPFFLFSASCFVTAIFCLFYIPETKGKSLEEIQYILKGQPYVVPQNTEPNNVIEQTYM